MCHFTVSGTDQNYSNGEPTPHYYSVKNKFTPKNEIGCCCIKISICKAAKVKQQKISSMPPCYLP